MPLTFAEITSLAATIRSRGPIETATLVFSALIRALAVLL